jgi:ring-1,2-phenylacetyl-CoA epoxidase subunit PaaE
VTQFHPLTIKDIRRETPDCVSIAFDVPESLAGQYRFQAGQNITLRIKMDGEEVRRSYSICSSPFDNELRVAVKKLDEGKFSGHANLHLKAGDVIEVLPPTGRFNNRPEANHTGSYLAFAAGSGITPVISIVKSTLATEPKSSFTLVYGNRNRSSIIFREQLEGLKNKYMDRFIIHHILSREETDAPVNHGRIEAEKCELLSKYLIDVEGMDHIFICGPEEMIFSVRDWLGVKGVPKQKIHFELFTVPGEKTRTQRTEIKTGTEKTSRIKLKLDGNTIVYDLPFDGRSVLDGALQQGADLPFACKGGVCATCRAKLTRGEVEMDNNYALEAEELEAGYILTCQSHPRTEEVEIDFDVK